MDNKNDKKYFTDQGLLKEPAMNTEVLYEYPPGEDIYSRSQKTGDPEELVITDDGNQNNFAETIEPITINKDSDSSDLDVPGAELDDKEENTGNEDEENNYYSVGGDDHNDLEEND